jgi:hypothetical protein
MFERLKFARYALRFEKAFKTDRWDDVRACFADDGVYVIEGSASEYDGEYRGPDAICGVFKKMLDAYDRRFDSRKPGFDGWPRVTGGELVLPWRATYRMGAESVELHGLSRCRFSGSKIARLSDTMRADECTRWAELASSAGPRAGASSSSR